MLHPIAASKLMCAAVAAGAFAAMFACAPAAQAESAYRVATRQFAHAPVRAQNGPTILELAREHKLPKAAGNMTKTLDYPYGITVGPTGIVYVTNLFAGVNVYAVTHQLLATITSGLSYPAAVALSFNGNIYVANNGASNVTIYNPSLTQIGTITDSTLVSPQSMYIDGNDTVWVLDAGGTLHSYLNDGTTLASTHTGGNTVGPWGPNVTVWGIANPNGGYDEDFENVAQAVHDGPSLFNVFSDGSPYAGDETEDALGQQYVSDLTHDQIQIWARNGAYQAGTINTPGAPYGVAVDSPNKRLYVAFTTLDEVIVYSTVAPYKQLGIIH